MNSISDIDQQAKRYSEACALLRDRVQRMKDVCERVERRLMPGIRSATIDAKTQRVALRDMISDSPDLFVKPKTLILSGVKVGFVKGKGKISWAKDQVVNIVKQIKKLFPEKEDVLIKKDEKPIKKALNGLSAQDLRKLGVTVVEAGESIVVSLADSNVDKIVKALLDEGLEQEDSDDE